ncbi:universal stress protein [Roseobacter sinensis]|uniref:Universal stress protein n=1 Tax=Roseobacter sinensis TaxID=2931391 RepID=A0ABT3BD23_9RHOB|nr:universal stress protein [Roseobacter sp. WL0113]MCV3271481.1 universal stress protein [Roseobacter sp. WL0113]
MTRRTTLLVLNAETPDGVISEAAEIAAAHQNRLTCLLIGPAPALPMYAYGVPPYGSMSIPDNWSELVVEAQQAQSNRVDEIEALLAKSGAAGDVRPVMCATADVRQWVSRSACVSDEAFIAPSLRDAPEIFREVAYGVLFQSPIGLRANGSTAPEAERVFIAWNTSQEAASAVHAALPYLRAAKEVVVGCIDPVMTQQDDGQDPGTDVAAWLSHHGCTVTVSQYPSGGRDVAACILDRAQEIGADLVVMGAYGHARMVQAVFGGTTRSMLEQTDMPVFLAH